MASYRGIECAALADSLRHAEQFLRQCDLGPETAHALDSWLAKNPFELLSRARDDQALVWILASTGSASLTARFHDVFAHHAMVEFQKGETDGTAQKLYRDLSAWNAFESRPSGRAIPAEVVEHVILECIDLLHQRGADEVVPERGAALRAMAGYDETAEWLEDKLQILDLMSGTSARQEARAFINGDHPIDKIILKGILYDKTGLSGATAALDVPHAIRRYLIVPAVAGDVSTQAEDDLAAFLEPYRKTGEFAPGSARIVSDGFENIGVAFRATPGVAEKVAANFGGKAGFRLVDAEGQSYVTSPQPT